jgi:DNA invertase Pin-like site-specific DNA recombinase
MSIPILAAKTAAALYRISDDRQDSLPTQREWAHRVAQRDGLTLAGEFEDEGISGACVLRPALEQLAAFIKDRFYARDIVQHLLVIDLDRFGRRDSLSTSGWLDKLRQHGLRYFVTTTQRFDLHSSLDRTLINLGSDFTREPELRAKSNHVLNGMAERARRGLWMGGPVPLGYRGEPDLKEAPNRAGRHPTRLVLGPPEEVEIVRWIFATYASGRLTANGIARALNAKGVKPRWSKSETWSRNSVLKILGNRTYLGCTVWGEQQVGRYHRLEKGMAVPREDKENREQHQLYHGLKHLPVHLAGEEDCIVCPNAHDAIIDPETFEACQRQRQRNRENYSAPRCRAGLKNNVWPLAGQMKCGHCGKPVWTLPKPDLGDGRHGSYIERARLACSERRNAGKGGCPHSGYAAYVDVLGRVMDLLKQKLGHPEARAEMERELTRQLAEQGKAAKIDRGRLEKRIAQLDSQIANATKALLQFPDDLKADGFEQVRGLKAQRDNVGQQLRDLDASLRASPAIDPEEFKATLAQVDALSPSWETREEAELMRASLRDLVQEVRLYWRPRRKGEKLPRGRQATQRLLRRVEADLTPGFADLLTMGSHNSKSPQTS